jgi:hypothetical protein
MACIGMIARSVPEWPVETLAPGPETDATGVTGSAVSGAASGR